MKPELAEHHFGALPSAVANSIASVSASVSPRSPATVMLFFGMKPGLPICELASRIRLSHAGTRHERLTI
jgi:hypothetical protein